MTTIIIPNELNITINTSVPGFQTIKYKPSMTIPNINILKVGPCAMRVSTLEICAGQLNPNQLPIHPDLHNI